jgi:hypothetical protein
MAATVLMVWEEENALPTLLAPRQPVESQQTVKPQLIFVAGPVRSDTGDDPWLIEANEAVMTETSLRLFRAGHVPVMVEWLALPLMEHAGSGRMGDSVFNEIFRPLACRLIEKCDGILRAGGPSGSADEMLEIGWDLGKTVYMNLDELTGAPVIPGRA